MDNEWDDACVMLVKLGITFNSLHQFSACLWTPPKSLYSKTHFVGLPLRRGIVITITRGKKRKQQDIYLLHL
jgi:hypothetical protein